MNTSQFPQDAEEPTRPLTAAEMPAAQEQNARPHTSSQDSVASQTLLTAEDEYAQMKPKIHKSLWRRMLSPLYIFGLGPWISFLSLILLGVVSTTLTSIALPSLGASIISAASGVFLIFTPIALGLTIFLLPILGIWFGHFERWRLSWSGHGEVPNGHVEVHVSNPFQWLKVRCTEVATWREVGSLILGTITSGLAGIVIFAETICFFIAYALWHQLVILKDNLNIWYPTYLQVKFDSEIAFYKESLQPNFDPNIDLDHPQWRITTDMWWLPIVLVIVGLIVFAYINGIMAATSASLSKLVLSPRPEEYERQLAKLTASRSTIVNSFESERRRIERNLHDGVQQELVNISLRLGLAEMEAKNLIDQGHPAERVQQQVAQSKEDLKHALETLRNTVRGIYPAVLEDHGLHAALEELANHTIIPTRLHYQAPEDLPAEVARIAYYTANEAIANALKHTSASLITITAWNSIDKLVLEITDNGGGGADPARGTGLAGLHERATTIGGTVEVTSVPGASSTITLKLPLKLS